MSEQIANNDKHPANRDSKLYIAWTFFRTQIYIILWFLPYNVFSCSLIILFGRLIPKKHRVAVITKAWALPLIWGARIIVGLKHEIKGLQNIPESGVIVCNHQSTWEALYMLVLFCPHVSVLKKSLLKVPFYGWAMRVINPIAIDRSSPRKAARQVLDEGTERLNSGDEPFLLIYPEGTRNKPGKLGKFNRSAATLAIQAQKPLIPVAQNSGVYWQKMKHVIFPGTVKIEILPAIDCSDKTAYDIMEQAKESIETSLNSMPLSR